MSYAVLLRLDDESTIEHYDMLVGPNCDGLVNTGAVVQMAGFFISTTRVLVVIREDGDVADDIDAVAISHLRDLDSTPSMEVLHELVDQFERGIC